ECLAEGGDDLDRIHAGDEAGDDRRDGHDQHRIELQREADDDKGNADQRPVIDHSFLLPKPPPPGVSMTKESPVPTSADCGAENRSIDESARTTQLRPGSASPPPASPRGATRRRLARMLARIGSRNVTLRTVPPRRGGARSPPEPRRIENSSSRTGKRVSRISGSVSRLLVIWVWTALAPSWSGPAPAPPAIVS